MKCPRSDGERGFLEHHGRKGFPVLLELRGETTEKMIHELRAHAAELSATGCETTGTQPCKVTFELYECPVRAHRHHRHHHREEKLMFCGLMWAIFNFCCCLGFLRCIRLICMGCHRRARHWRSQGADGNSTAPFLSSA